MKKIRLFSAKATKRIEGEDAELYVNFYLVLNKDYIFTFLIDAPNLSCSDRHPIKLWKHFLIMFEEEYVKYMRRWERKGEWITDKERLGYWISTCSECGHIFHGNEVLIYKPKFCSNCGARMREVKE